MYVDPGSDQAWFTEDDLPNYHDSTTFNVDGVILAYKTYHLLGSVNDALPGTEDDYIQQSTTTLDIESGTTKYINFTGRGQDNAMFTEDDPVSDYKLQKEVVSNDSQERRSITTHYTSAGSDGRWFTSDDVAAEVTASLSTLNDHSQEFINYIDAGTNGAWFTEDDKILKRTEYDPLN